jgi:nitroreductase
MTTLSKLLAERFGPVADTHDTEVFEDSLARIIGRRTIRRYADEPVADELRLALLACAQSAPAKSDLQQYSIIDIADAAVKSKLAELSDTGAIARAPIVLVFCADIRRAQRITQMRGHVYAQNTLDSFMNAVIDASLALQSFMIAAEAAGLGACAISQVRKQIDETAALLALPDGVAPIAGLTAGWPAEERDVTMRLPPSVVVHRDGYDDGNLEAEIDAYDQRRHAIRPTAPERQLHQDLYGIAEFYGWSENAARRLSVPDKLGGLCGFLERHGFDLS